MTTIGDGPEARLLKDAVKTASSRFGEAPKIILTGKTGAGKSSIVNALLNKHAQNVDVVPCTQTDAELDWNAGDQNLKLVDVPGFAEAGKHQKWMEFILHRIPDAHLALLAIGAPDRALEHERRFVEDVRAVEKDFPLIVAANRIDMINPVRDWSPESLDLKKPTTDKEKNIRKWVGEVKKVTRRASQVVPVAAGERFDDYENQYGLDQLQNAIFDALPKAAKNFAARALRLKEIKTKQARKVIWANAVAAAGFAAAPIPLADNIPITGLQVEMIISIGFIFGVDLSWKNALSLLGPALAGLTGPLAVKELAKLIPGVGSVVGAGVAGAITLALGETYLKFFAKGDFVPDPEEVKEEFRKQYESAKNHKEDIKRKAKRSGGK